MLINLKEIALIVEISRFGGWGPYGQYFGKVKKYQDNDKMKDILLDMMKSDDINTNLIKRNEFI